MKPISRKLAIPIAIVIVPLLVDAFIDGPPIRRTGAAVDGGLDCTTGCHNSFGSANSDPAGRILIEAAGYRPRVDQTIRVIVEHPEAKRWGFQLTARRFNDPTQQAGAFTPDEQIRVVCDPSEEEAPCNGDIEFATHRRTSTQDDRPDRAIWTIKWTAPGDDVGDIVFFAAGNAAGDPLSNNQGDRIYTTSLTISNAGACSLLRKPTLRNVGNGASFQLGGTASSMVSVFGMDFQIGTPKQVTLTDIVDGRFPEQLGCIAVEIDGRRAPIAYVQNDQINAQAPAETPSGPVEVKVFANPGWPNELRSDLATINFTDHHPGLFTFPFSTSVAAIFPQTGVPVTEENPISPGAVVSLFGTGFGATDPPFAAGAIVDRVAWLRDPIRVFVDGIMLPPEDVLYAGLSPGSISGLYQFNIRIPLTVSAGNVSVEIEIGGVRTQAGVTLPVQSII
ncbi:MAG: hypothetical protein GY953_23575 [bacterium]|nr:hypothetical protein [bacterium]